MLGIGAWKQRLPHRDDALPGREQSIIPADEHHVHGRALHPEAFPNSESVLLGMGCFWGAEKKFWITPGVPTMASTLLGEFSALWRRGSCRAMRIEQVAWQILEYAGKLFQKAAHRRTLAPHHRDAATWCVTAEFHQLQIRRLCDGRFHSQRRQQRNAHV